MPNTVTRRAVRMIWAGRRATGRLTALPSIERASRPNSQAGLTPMRW